jgi:hypothetical protein
MIKDIADQLEVEQPTGNDYGDEDDKNRIPNIPADLEN